MNDKATKFKQLDRLVQVAMELGQAFERAKRASDSRAQDAQKKRDRAWAMYYKCRSKVREVQRELAGLEPMREVAEEVAGV